MVGLLGMQGAYGERRLQQAPRRSHYTAKVRTTKPKQYAGKRRVNASLRWGEGNMQSKPKVGKNCRAAA